MGDGVEGWLKERGRMVGRGRKGGRDKGGRKGNNVRQGEMNKGMENGGG